MSNFNIEFGNKLKSERLKKELTIKYVALKVGKNESTIFRYEQGEILPDAEVLNKLCKVLDIYTGDLFNEIGTNIVNKEDSINPFITDKLYLYYKGFVGKKKLGKFKFIINLAEQKDFIEVKIADYKNKKVILIGNMLADNNMVSIRTENYKPNCPRLETNQIIVNISESTNGLLLGLMTCTNGNYVPNIKKVIISKQDLPFTTEMLFMLDLSEEEQNNIQENGIWLANIEKIQDYEIKE